MRARDLEAVAMLGMCVLFACLWVPPVTVVGTVADDVRSGAKKCEVQFFSEHLRPKEPARVGAGGRFVLYEHIGRKAARGTGEDCRIVVTCDGIVRLNIGVRLWYEKEAWFDVGTIGLTTGPTVTAEVRRGNWITEGPKVE